MKKIFYLLFMLAGISSTQAQTTEVQGIETLNNQQEFFVVKNEAKKQVIVTKVITVTIPDGVSLTTKNEEVKKQLTEQLILSGLVKQEEMASWSFKATGTDAQGELFEDEAAADKYRLKIVADLKKKTYKVEDFPFAYKP